MPGGAAEVAMEIMGPADRTAERGRTGVVMETLTLRTGVVIETAPPEIS